MCGKMAGMTSDSEDEEFFDAVEHPPSVDRLAKELGRRLALETVCIVKSASALLLSRVHYSNTNVCLYQFSLWSTIHLRQSSTKISSLLHPLTCIDTTISSHL